MALASWAIEEVKSGYIRPFYGFVADIPAGWLYCDGNNGTPDMSKMSWVETASPYKTTIWIMKT